MIDFEPDELFEALCTLARREGHATPLDRGAMVGAITAALAEARQLAAADRPEHAPAAVFYAFGRRSTSFRPVARFFIDMLVQAQAIAIGCDVDMSDVQMVIHRARLLRGEIEFLELRGWFAARLRPLGQKVKRSPPKRPR